MGDGRSRTRIDLNSPSSQLSTPPTIPPSLTLSNRSGSCLCKVVFSPQDAHWHDSHLCNYFWGSFMLNPLSCHFSALYLSLLPPPFFFPTFLRCSLSARSLHPVLLLLFHLLPPHLLLFLPLTSPSRRAIWDCQRPCAAYQSYLWSSCLPANTCPLHTDLIFCFLKAHIHKPDREACQLCSYWLCSWFLPTTQADCADIPQPQPLLVSIFSYLWSHLLLCSPYFSHKQYVCWILYIA